MNNDLAQAQVRIDRALELLDAGFTTKSGQKQATDYLNRAFDRIRDAFRPLVWNLFDGDRENVDHEAWGQFLMTTGQEYDLPFDLHHVRERHIAKVRELSEDLANKIAFMVETRAAIKAAPIQKVEPKAAVSEYQRKAEMSLKELMEKRQAQYLEAVELGRIFEGLPVSANTHGVVNQFGTFFLRTYYYLNGKLTPLSVIIAAAEQLAREAEGRG